MQIPPWEVIMSILHNYAPEDSDMETKEYNCPICNRGVNRSFHYPNYVCKRCVAKAVDEYGRPIVFSNQCVSGGFVAQYADTGEIRQSHICFISGFRCYADEARFGGIVVKLQEDSRF